jgi:N-acetylmuramoyl-L-alanine amidase
VGDILKNNGIDVAYTRTEDVYDTPYEKAVKGNESGAALFLSIHRNSYPVDNYVNGVETLIYDKSGQKLEIAESINEELEKVGFENKGITERPNLVVLKRTKMPAVLVEAGFLNSDVDNKIFDENFNAVAQAIADGVLNVINKEQNVVATSGTIKMEPQGRQKEPSRKEECKNKKYNVILGSFSKEQNAKAFLQMLIYDGFLANMEMNKGVYRVFVGEFNNLEDAIEMEQMLRRSGYDTYILASCK